MSQSKTFLQPEAIQRISRLDLRARHVVEGFLSGLHRSPYFGQSIEFLQHRQYTWGDDLRYVDWKVWAKQDRFYVKQFEEDTNLRLTLLVDVSGSMQYGSGAMTKHEYACTVAASMAYLVLKQQDAVGCVSFDESVRQSVPQRTKREPSRLAPPSPRRQRTEEQDRFLPHPPRCRRNVSPPRHDGVGFRSACRARGALPGPPPAARRGHDVMVFHVLDDDELDFPFNGATRFDGIEVPEQLACNPRALREGYLAALGQYLEEVRRGCAQHNVDYVLLRTSQSLGSALASFLNHRLATHHRT